MTETDVLKDCTVEGNIVKLPPIQLERKLYMDVAKRLNLIGGKWKGGKTMGFVFPDEVVPQLDQLLGKLGEGEKINPKKEFQFFETPTALAEKMALKLQPYPDARILEPSAGQGALVNAVLNLVPNVYFFLCEMMPTNKMILQKRFEARKNVYYLAPLNDDFLELTMAMQYDLIIANPPFANNKDIDHIRHMYDVLKPGGRMVTIASTHWMISSFKKETQFHDWLQEVATDIEEIPRDTFKESGTSISTVLITIDK
jgi:phospholipid N-methyltransferase